jgi:hypothetical protein
VHVQTILYALYNGPNILVGIFDISELRGQACLQLFGSLYQPLARACPPRGRNDEQAAKDALTHKPWNDGV